MTKRLVAIYGDSQSAICHGGTAPYNLVKSFGYAFWVAHYSGGKINVPRELNYGVAGDTTTQMLARLSTVASAPVDLVLVQGGGNDNSGDIDPSVTVQNIVEICRKLVESGKTVCYTTTTPRAVAQAQATNRINALLETRKQLLQVLPLHGVLVADPWAEMVDPNSATYLPLPGLLYDDLHSSPKGAEIVGRTVWNAIKHLPFFGARLLRSNVVYNATSNPLGALTVNPLMTGAGGGVQASCNPVAGSVAPTGWLIYGENFGGLSTTSYVEGDELVIKVSGKSNSASLPAIGIYQDLTMSQVLANDQLKGSARLKLKGSTGAVLGAGAGFVIAASSYYGLADGDAYGANWTWAAKEYSSVTETPTFVNSGTTPNGITLRVSVTLQPQAAQALEIRISRAGVFKIV